MHALQDDQDLFHAALQTAGSDVNLLERFAGADYGHLADRKALRKYAIVAGSVEPLADIDPFLILDVLYLAVAMANSFECAAHVILCRDYTGREVAIDDQHHQGSRGIRIHHFAHDSVWCHHGHSAFHTAGRTTIHKDHLGVRTRPVS